MNNRQHISNQAELEQLIGRYFDGETTIEEEQTLGAVLADCPWSSETIDEALFAMGYFAAHKQQQRRTVTMAMRRRAIAIAASVAVLLTVGIGLLWQTRQPSDVCIAYVNGQTIHNEQEVLALMQGDLNDMSNATQSLEEQLSSLGEAIDIDI